ncbi:hypothetical protein D0Z08_01055 [Nocardioides immobilis]|uniref:Uncharacterized protein n=1 Tax=Nocardioides immobilis TaxID=2049295 RepID=A0A417Y7R2_9ACTN|nr:hypothetical protein [Nocardioides immobilis]RHW28494.1 hypothetical protein D0Z08_01055 [Nocardioides immobilis]
MAVQASEFASRFPHYFDPTDGSVATSTPASVVWSAFPARLMPLGMSTRWRIADSSRDEQDEYCEWHVERDSSERITAVVFTTEMPEYWAHLAETDAASLVSLYQDLVSADVTERDLIQGDQYLRDNPWNGSDSPGITHLRQGSNTLLAAIKLVADSTIQRFRDGHRVEDRRELVECGQLGDPRRNSDPQIADIINDTVHLGRAVSLAHPFGIYLDGIHSAGIEAPDGADTASFWTVERGEPGHAVRARFAVPPNTNLTVDGRPLMFGSQIADRVRIRVDVLTRPSSAAQLQRECGA